MRSPRKYFGPIPAVALGLYLFMYLPLLVVALFSFNASRYTGTWHGFSLQWYQSLFTDVQVRDAIKNTAKLASASTLISLLLGVLLAYGLKRHPFRGESFLGRVMLLSIAVPDIVMAVSLLLFFGIVRQFTGLLAPGLGTMILAHVTFQIPFVAMVISARLDGLDPAIEEAAFDLGASRFQRLWHVTLPLLRPGLVAAALLAFTLSLDDFVVSFFTSGPGATTLPIYVYSSVKRGVTAEINALSTLIILAAILGAIGLAWAQAKGRKAELTPK